MIPVTHADLFPDPLVLKSYLQRKKEKIFNETDFAKQYDYCWNGPVRPRWHKQMPINLKNFFEIDIEKNNRIEMYNADENVICGRLQDIVIAHNYLLKFFKKGPMNDMIRLFASAYQDETYVIYVKPHTIIESTIQLTTHIEKKHAVYNLIIIIDHKAQVKLQEQLISLLSNVIAVRNCTIILQDNALLSYTYKQLSSSCTNLIESLQVTSGQHSTATIELIQLGGCYLNSYIDLEAHNYGAKVTTVVPFIAHEQQEFVFTSDQKHHEPYTGSELSFYGVTADEASSSVTTMITIDQKAKDTNAKQITKQLLFSDLAKAVAKPSLEVNTHQVQCTHGAAVGQLDSEQINYMQTRGLPKTQTEQLLLEAFFNQCGITLNDHDLSKKLLSLKKR